MSEKLPPEPIGEIVNVEARVSCEGQHRVKVDPEVWGFANICFLTPQRTELGAQGCEDLHRMSVKCRVINKLSNRRWEYYYYYYYYKKKKNHK